jgi:hypothetical protein
MEHNGERVMRYVTLFPFSFSMLEVALRTGDVDAVMGYRTGADAPSKRVFSAALCVAPNEFDCCSGQSRLLPLMVRVRTVVSARSVVLVIWYWQLGIQVDAANPWTHNVMRMEAQQRIEHNRRSDQLCPETWVLTISGDNEA